MRAFVSRFQKWRERTPAAFTGGVLVNILGWQLLRVLWLNVSRSLHWYTPSEEVRAYAEVLKEQGAVLIPDFLPEHIAKEIRAEYERESREVTFQPLASKYIVPADGKTQVEFANFTPQEGTRLRALLDEHVIRNQFLRKLGSSVVRHDIQSYRAPQVFVNKWNGAAYPDLNSDIYYHADVSYPGVKAFYYLSDTDEANGAFMYAKGTHKLSLKRLFWDYRKSIEHAKNRAKTRNPKVVGDVMGRAWHCMTRDEERREGILGTSMNGKANSLLIFNVRGFHRRGEFSSPRLREFVLAYYRN